MARPIEITTPLPTTLLTGFGGAANTNLLPAQGSTGSYTPMVVGAFYDSGSTISGAPEPVASGGSAPNQVPASTPLIVGYTTKNKIALSRNLIIRSTADLSASTIRIRGVDANGVAVDSGNLVGPAAGGTITTTAQFAIVNSFTCPLATASDNFNLSLGLTLTTSVIRVDTFYPNSSITAGCILSGTHGQTFAQQTAQKVIVYNQAGIPSLNPLLIPLNSGANWFSFFGASTSNQRNTSNVATTGIYFKATGVSADATSQYTFFLTQQGVR